MAVNLTTKTTEIVLKGGRPWGFQLQGGIENGDILTVSQVAHDGKAAKEGSLKVGDRVLKINDVQCFSLAEALDLINNAFRTLSILIRRYDVIEV
ncbi:protein Shroom4-like [Tachypleus tridentatus]|uniref:protein Shroom4-like n=1 Tax=Tachypleus tridentatus TaxID=6853 RepID=UPI003FD135BE